MINVFFNVEYGYAHYWWEYPGTIEELIEDWNSGYAPFNNLSRVKRSDGRWEHKPYKGTLTQIPTHWDWNDPFGPGCPTFAGQKGSRTVHSGGETKEVQSNQMDDFFQAFGEVDVEYPYLRVGDDYYPAHGELLWEEEEIAKEFSWPEWTEDPKWYKAWAASWRKTHACNDPANVKRTIALLEGKLSPQEMDEVASHIGACQSCKDVVKTARVKKRYWP